MSTDQAHTLVDALWGESDGRATWHVEVLNAHAAALTWVYQATGRYPAPSGVVESLRKAADQLRVDTVKHDPRAVLVQVAAQALSRDCSSAA